MHAEALPRRHSGNDGLGVPIALAIAVHLLLALLFMAAYLWAPQRRIEPAAGSPVVEASLLISSADIRAAQQAMRDAPKPPEPQPQPLEEPVEDAAPPPQPIPEPRPQDAQAPQQLQAQERIPVTDSRDQEAADRLAVSQEKALKEQEDKRRQEQIDLTERQRQLEAENRQRLSQQAEEEKQKRIDQLRRQREQAAREADLAEQKLRQLANARARESSATTAAAASPPQGQGGNNSDLLARYQQAIQQAVLDQWQRPDSVPLGQKCKVQIVQVIGGDVIEAKVLPGCPFNEAGKRSLEAAVLRAQPLPYRGFESVFNRELIFNFTAEDR